MSVLVTIRVSGDTEQFRRLLADDPERFQQIADSARSQGCIHHRFGVGDGFVVVVDEWESPEAFQRFFESKEIADVMGDAGAQGQPEIVFSEAIDSPDQF